MRITLLGTGTPRPSLKRQPPSLVVHTPAGPWLVDCGHGVLLQLLRAGIDPRTVTRVILTHLHTDHTLGYGHLLFGGWSLGRPHLVVWGPRGTRRLHRLYEEVYAEDIAYRKAVLERPGGPGDVTVHEYKGGLVLEQEGVVVEALRVLHCTETYALRFRTGGQTIVISSDTRFCPALVEFARGADMLVHEAQMVASARELYPSAVWERLRAVHSSPAEAARVARLSGARRLVLVHLPDSGTEEEIRAECASEYDGEVVVGQDLLTVGC